MDLPRNKSMTVLRPLLEIPIRDLQELELN